MQTRKLKSILIGSIGLTLAIIILFSRGPENPNHAGRPVSAWFADLCTGVFGGTPRASGFAAAYAAFPQMETNVIPYLAHQLRYDRAGYRQKLIAYFRQFRVSSSLANHFIWPTEVRSYAAVALREMGPKAEAAVPALLDAWANDQPEVKVNVVSALESILGRERTEGASLAEWKKRESEIIAAAAARHPQVAQDLGISHKTAP